MPVVLDVGTDRRELVEDPNYLGLKTPRLKGDELYEVDWCDEMDGVAGDLTTRSTRLDISFAYGILP